jgi:hypothetical protein
MSPTNLRGFLSNFTIMMSLPKDKLSEEMRDFPNHGYQEWFNREKSLTISS